MADTEPPAKSGATLTVAPSVPNGTDTPVTASPVGPPPVTDSEGTKPLAPIETLDVEDGAIARTGWRLYAILASLFVRSKFLIPAEKT